MNNHIQTNFKHLRIETTVAYLQNKLFEQRKEQPKENECHVLSI